MDAAVWGGHVHVEGFRVSGFRVLALGFKLGFVIFIERASGFGVLCSGALEPL